MVINIPIGLSVNNSTSSNIAMVTFQVMLVIALGYFLYLIYFKKSNARTIVTCMIYSLPTICDAIIGTGGISIAYIIISIVGYIMVFLATIATFKQIENDEKKGITMYSYKDRAKEEMAFSKMSEEDKGRFYSSIKRTNVNFKLFAILYWGIQIITISIVNFAN